MACSNTPLRGNLSAEVVALASGCFRHPSGTARVWSVEDLATRIGQRVPSFHSGTVTPVSSWPGTQPPGKPLSDGALHAARGTALAVGPDWCFNWGTAKPLSHGMYAGTMAARVDGDAQAFGVRRGLLTRVLS